MSIYNITLISCKSQELSDLKHKLVSPTLDYTDLQSELGVPQAPPDEYNGGGDGTDGQN